MNIVLLGSIVRHLCQTPIFYKILNAESTYDEFGACDGGCLMVARALLDAGVRGVPYSIWGKRRYLFPVKHVRPHWKHILLKIGPNSFLDGDGLKTECEVYKWWTVGFEVSALRPTTKHWERIIDAYDDVAYDELIVKNLAMYFKVALDKRGLLD